MPKKQRFHIYAINIDGQIYVGSTNNTKRRLKDHRTRCFNPNAKHYPCKFYKYIRDKYNRTEDDEEYVGELVAELTDKQKRFIDSKTMNIHYNKHYKGYVEKLNKAIKDKKGKEKSLEDIVKTIFKRKIYKIIWICIVFFFPIIPKGLSLTIFSYI